MKEYLLNKLEEEQDIIEKILEVDNRVQKTNYDYNYVHNLVSNTNIVSNNLKSKYILITDGELSTIIYMLLNYTQNIMCININHMTVGLNMWLIKKINEFGIEIYLDKNNNYNIYDEYDRIMVAGFKEFVDGTSLMYENKDVIKIYL